MHETIDSLVLRSTQPQARASHTRLDAATLEHRLSRCVCVCVCVCVCAVRTCMHTGESVCAYTSIASAEPHVNILHTELDRAR